MGQSDANSLFAWLDGAIRARLDPFAENRVDPRAHRLHEVRRFLQLLKLSNKSMGDLGSVVAEIRPAASGAFAPGTTFDISNASSYLTRLSLAERQALEMNLEGLVEKIRAEFPELVDEFPEQFPGRRIA
jgi:hypothetical protein